MLPEESLGHRRSLPVDVERLIDWQVDRADQGFQRSSAVRALEQFTDELGDGHAAFVCPLRELRGDLVRQMHGHRHSLSVPAVTVASGLEGVAVVVMDPHDSDPTVTIIGTLPVADDGDGPPSGDIGVDASVYDADQTDGGFTVTIDQDSLPFGVTAGSPLTQTVVISDTTPTVQFADAVHTLDEGASAEIRVNLNQRAPAGGISGMLRVAAKGGVATAETGDVTVSPVRFTIAEGEFFAAVTVTAAVDSDHDDETTAISVAGLDDTRVRLDATASSVAVTVYDTGGSRIGFNAAHRTGGFDSFAGPGYIGEGRRTAFYLGLASAPRADVTAVAKIIVGTQMERYDSDGDGDTDTDDEFRIADSLRNSGGSRVESATLTFTPAGWTHKPLTVQAGYTVAHGDKPIVVEFALTSTDPAYHDKTWRLVVMAIDRDGFITYSFVTDEIVDWGESGDPSLNRLEVRASRRVPDPMAFSDFGDFAATARFRGARRDRDDFVFRGGTIPVGKTTGHMFISVTDDDLVERTAYTHIIQHDYPGGEFTVARVRIADDDTSYVQVINTALTFSHKMDSGVDLDVLFCAVGGQRFSGDPAWAKTTLYSGATEVALPSQADLAEIGGIVVMLPATPTYTWDHDGLSATPEVPYLAFDEWDPDKAIDHPQGFDVQLGGHADADCSVDFGGQP